ncbi:MAG: hypothetical protein H7X88_12360 [Gloeobacteraceae cyanobacterium ES-bin-316]|nr:hypothetical protein [Ferruginibacter sp.]
MKFIVVANDDAFEELSSGKETIEWIKVKDATAFKDYADADAFFNLDESAYQQDYSSQASPVFINSVAHCLPDTGVLRFNGWNGFIKNETWEIAGQITNEVKLILSSLNKKFLLCADVPGFVSARIIAMIINEAWYALGDDISSQEEIDIAMKLGTNYPYGPFEWGQKIGIKNIYTLLMELSRENKKYSPAPKMVQLINSK